MRHYVYDFDSTLYATQRMWDVWSGMLATAGFDRAAVFESYQRIVPSGYSPRKHAASLGVDDTLARDLVGRFNVILSDESPSLLFGDVAPFLEARRHTATHSILTQGDEEHQWEKMRASGVDRLLPNVVITKPDGLKVEHLADMLDKDSMPITFIDDNPHHLLPAYQNGLPITLIRMKRPGETLAAAPHELDDVAWRVISSLDELDQQ